MPRGRSLITSLLQSNRGILSSSGIGFPRDFPSRSRGSPNFRNFDIVFVASTLSNCDMTVISAKKSEIIRPAASQAFLLCQNEESKKGEKCQSFIYV